MSQSIRPIIEQWGPTITSQSRHVSFYRVASDIANILMVRHPDIAVVEVYEGEGQFDDYGVVTITNGSAFLQFLDDIDIDELLDLLQSETSIPDDPVDSSCYKLLVSNMKAVADLWKSYVDPDNGTIQFYCD